MRNTKLFLGLLVLPLLAISFVSLPKVSGAYAKAASEKVDTNQSGNSGMMSGYNQEQMNSMMQQHHGTNGKEQCNSAMSNSST